ncbi:MAG TPA: hypothetical protein VJ742_03275, partial [Nitrososphaera sp.]|nr:hypothetical protein [Nitrososphaera sp.]
AEDRDVLQQAVLQCQSCCQTVVEDQALHDPRHPQGQHKPQGSLLTRRKGRDDLASRRRSAMSMPRQRGAPITREDSPQRPGDKTGDSSHDADCGKETLLSMTGSNVGRLEIRKQRSRTNQQGSYRNQCMPVPVYVRVSVVRMTCHGG